MGIQIKLNRKNSASELTLTKNVAKKYRKYISKISYFEFTRYL